MTLDWTILRGDVMDALRTLPDDSIDLVATSPPYWGLRDYGIPPSVWGGQTDCDHRWDSAGSAEGFTSKTRWQHSNNGRGEQQPQQKVLRDKVTRENRPECWGQIGMGAFCSNCGAWKGCLGLEPAPDLFVEHMVLVFREVHRVLKPSGNLYVNIGDCYATGAGRVGDSPGGGEQGARWAGDINRVRDVRRSYRRDRADVVPTGNRGIHTAENSGKAGPRIAAMGPMTQPNRMPLPGLKPKDLVGVPWMLAFALRSDGWWLREEIIWHKKNPMPSSARDRCTRSHEQVFHLTKSRIYFYDADAIAEPYDYGDHPRNGNPDLKDIQSPGQYAQSGFTRVRRGGGPGQTEGRRNRRSVWSIATSPFPEAHFATFPAKLVEPMIQAGSSEAGVCATCGAPWERVGDRVFVPQEDVSEKRGIKGAEGQKPMDESNGWEGSPRGTTERSTLFWHPTCEHCPGEAVPAVVLDPFSGAGTTGLVASRLGRRYIGIELSKDYAEMSARRIRDDAPLLNASGAVVECGADEDSKPRDESSAVRDDLEVEQDGGGPAS